MALNGELIARYPLANGLTLEFWDYSRTIAGDRWYMSLEVRIAIPITPDTLPPDLQGQAVQVRALLGVEIVFSQKVVRNFIAEAEAPIVLKDMQDRFLVMAPGYFGHPDFAAKFMRRKFTEKKELQRWQQYVTPPDDTA
jgi:hypothetical protein